MDIAELDDLLVNTADTIKNRIVDELKAELTNKSSSSAISIETTPSYKN